MIDQDILNDVFDSFRKYLPEYVRESVYETVISEIPIHGTVELFNGITPGTVQLKNQGSVECYITTANLGGYRLDPGEKINFFVNTRITVTTVSGSTTLGFIKF